LGVHPAIDVPLDLSHLWSLGVEGQFYLVWPLLLWGLYRWVGAGRRLIAVLGAAIVGVALLRALEFHSFGGWARVYTRFDTRADSLLVGALLAVVCARGLLPARNLRLWLAAAGAAGLAFALVLATPEAAFLYWGGLTAVAVAGAAILSVTLDRRGRLPHALSWSPIRCVGLASYSIYLWHLPVYLWAVRVVPGGGIARITVALSATALTSTVSYLLLERPYMRQRGRLVSPSAVRVKQPALAEA
jgi:peptidoglycan/LPS O-acetylase OafA/YrhL